MEIIAIIAGVWIALAVLALSACKSASDADDAMELAYEDERRRREEWPWPTR